MDALWSLEDKWKISTRKAVSLLVCTAILVIFVSAVVIVMLLRKKGNRNRIACLDLDDNETESSSSLSLSSSSSLSVTYEDQNCCSKYTFCVRNVILGSPCWSMAHKWTNNEDYVVNKCKYWSLLKEVNIMSKCVKFSCCVGSKLKPVWQRPILMGEKCVFPKFSGLILYDEKGRPLPHQHHNNVGQHNENYHGIEEGAHIVDTNTLLRDLL